MNIHLPAILMFTRGTRFWHTAISYQGWPSLEDVRGQLSAPDTFPMEAVAIHREGVVAASTLVSGWPATQVLRREVERWKFDLWMDKWCYLPLNDRNTYKMGFGMI